MNRTDGLKKTLEMIQDIEGQKLTDEEKKFWTMRMLLVDIASSLATIADNTNLNPTKDKGADCEGCKYIYRGEKDYPCINCKHAHGNMWEARGDD